MSIQRLFAAASVAAVLSGTAMAQGAPQLKVAPSTVAPSTAGLKPAQSQRIDLGKVGGDAYYTVEDAGYHVVATFAPRGDYTQPVRFEAVLAPGQSVRFSTPNAVGTPPSTVEIVRHHDAVLVQKAAS